MPKSDIEWATGQWKARNESYRTYSNYYNGDHPLLFATEKFRNVFGPLFRAFADNLCPAVVDSAADRLKVTGWDGPQATAADKLWADARLKRVMKQVFHDAGTSGDAYVLVWPGTDDKAVYWPHDAQQMCVRYDEDNDPDKVVTAAKQWILTTGSDKGKVRLNLYYEKSIEKYITTQVRTSDDSLPDKLDAWTGVTDKNIITHDYGMPVFHFGNDADIGDYGVSDLKSIIPLQDALNKAVCDMLVAMEFVAYPQRYATGLQVETDEETGRPIKTPFTPGVDRVWAAAGEVKFGEFTVADLDNFLNVQNNVRAEIARVSGTPTHYLNLEAIWPTGEALKVSEGRLIKRLQNRADAYDGRVIDMTAFGLKINGGSTDNPDIKPVWANPNPHNPLLDAEEQVVKQSVGVSEERSLSELGYTDEEITEMQKQNTAKAEASAQRAATYTSLPSGKTPFAKGQDPSGQPTAHNRNGSPGQASKPAPRQQSGKRPIQPNGTR